MKTCISLIAILLIVAPASRAANPPATPKPITHRIIGLFSPDREADLREALKDIAEVLLVKVDFPFAQATFLYDGSKANTEKLNNLLRQAHFGIAPISATPDKLTRIEIPVIGLDCKGCAYGAYRILQPIEGVEQAAVDFHVGKISALIDPSKTDRAAIEAALKKKQVEVGVPTPSPAK